MKFVLRSLSLFVCLVVSASSFASTPTPITSSACPITAPKMDGVYSPHEWDGARTLDFTVNVPEGGTAPARLYFTNDSNFLYIALRVQRTVTTDATSFNVFLDTDHNNTASAGDDGFAVSNDVPASTPGDIVYFTGGICPAGSVCSANDTDRGGSNDTRAGFRANGTTLFYELAKPLYSIDPNDAYLQEGDTIGMTFSLRLMSPGATWPNGVADTYYPGTPSAGPYVNYMVRICGF